MLQSGVKRCFGVFVKPSFSIPHMEKPEDLSTFGGRLRAAMKAKGAIRQRSIANHFRITEQAVSQWVRNETAPDTGKIFGLAEILGVNPQWLIDGTAPRFAEQQIQEITMPEINVQQWARDVPILGGASCGDGGMFEMNGQTLDFARRPPRLAGAKGIYALYVQGDSMSPWREPGGLVYVHPHQPVKIGDYVVVQMVPEGPDLLPAAYIKKLVRRTADRLVLLQFNPREEKTLAAKKVKAIHRIMDWDEMMGI